MGSVSQRALKLLAVNVGGLKKKSAASAFTAEVCARAISPGSTSSGSNHSQTLTDGNFAAL